jgi:hypothetical protein
MVRRISFIILTAVIIMATWAFSADDRYLRLTRISYIEGDVSYQRSPEVDWSAASINMPMEPGDRIYTGPNGRIEIEFEDNTVLRLAENTDVEFLSLNDDRVQLRMLVGLATLSVSSNSDFEINTPAAAFNTVSQGIYRFEVDESGTSNAIVRVGKMEAANNYFSCSIDSRQRIRVRPGTDGNREVMAYDGRDIWDEWTDRRVIDLRASTSRRYLPSTVSMGSAELDRYGRWVTIAGYGSAWVPNDVDSYWSPYSVGRWCYRPSFGWTWVSYEPWGWLPYHYGRWQQHASFGWCWIPGEGFSFNFWSPGLVAFYSGTGWISWCPLGPGDYYNINHYHYNRGIYQYQVDRLRRLHTRAAGDSFNRNARGAFRTVDVDRFRSGSFNERSSDSRWGNIARPWKEGNFVRERFDLAPNSASFRAAPDRPAARPRMDRERPVVVRSEPPSRENNRNHNQFSRITNPQVPPAPSRWSIGREPSNNENRRESGRPEPAKSNSSRWSINREVPRPSIGNREQERLQTQPERIAPASQERTAPEQGMSHRDQSTPQNNSRWRNDRPVISTPPLPAAPPSPSEPQRENRNFGSRERIVTEPSQGNSPPSDATPSRWRTEGRSEHASPSSNNQSERPSESTSRSVKEPSQEKSNSGHNLGRWGSIRDKDDSRKSSDDKKDRKK